jgi:TonB family protein
MPTMRTIVVGFAALALLAGAAHAESDPREAWVREVVAATLCNFYYPDGARRRGESGVVNLIFSVDERGNMLDVRVGVSSGWSELDQAALAGLLRSSPLPALPRIGLARYRLPVRFTLAQKEKRDPSCNDDDQQKRVPGS